MAVKIRRLAGKSKTIVPLHGWSIYPRDVRSGSNLSMESTMPSNFKNGMAALRSSILRSRSRALRGPAP
jgi:hypothetical protein